MSAPLLLIDAASLYYRAFYGVPDRRRTPDEPPTNAVRGFMDMLASLANSYLPPAAGRDRNESRGAMVACWDDDWRPAFRVAAIASYKAHRVHHEPDGSQREQSPPELDAQVPVIRDVLAAIGIARIGSPGYEADDVIGTLATRWARRCPIHIVTGDRDLFQLVDDATQTDVLYTARKGVRGATRVDEAYLYQTYGVRGGDGYADFAILRGDPSDGLPGVKGIGEKSATALLGTYGDLAGIRAAAADPDSPMSTTQRKKICAAKDYLDQARTVVGVARDAPIPHFDPQLPTRIADLTKMSALASTYRLAPTFERLLDALGLEG